MNTPERIQSILADYDARRTELEQFTEVIERLLDDLVAPLRGNQVKRIHLVRARLKSRESLRSKLERPERTDNALSDITDVCGARVITYYADDVDKVSEIVESQFQIDWPNSTDKRALLDPDRFGYLSVHYVVSLSPARRELPEYPFGDQKVEIQARSVLQHGWAEIERGLGYRDRTLPDTVRRRFSMLAGLLEMADNQFIAIRDDLVKYRAEVVETITVRPESVSIDRDSVRAYVTLNRDVKRLDHQLADMRKATVAESDDRAFNTWASHLKAAGFTTIGEVDTTIRELSPKIIEFARIWLKDAPQVASVKTGYALFFLCYFAAAKGRSADHVIKYLKAAGITRFRPPVTLEQVASDIVDLYNRIIPEEPLR